MVLVPKEHWYIILRIFRIEFFGISETYIGTFVDKHLEPQWFNYLNEIILFADLEQTLILQNYFAGFFLPDIMQLVPKVYWYMIDPSDGLQGSKSLKWDMKFFFRLTALKSYWMENIQIILCLVTFMTPKGHFGQFSLIYKSQKLCVCVVSSVTT